MVDPNSPYSDEKLLIKRGRVDSVNLYEVKEDELELLEKGPAGTAQLNFAIFLFSMAGTCAAALATSTFKWEIVQLIFIVTMVVGFLLGAYLIIIWRRTKVSVTKIVLTIRNRIDDDPPPVQNQDAPETQPKKPESDEEPYG